MKMKLIWRQIETWLEANAPKILEDVAGAATATDIEDAEKQLGCRLPRALRDSYLIHNGSIDLGLFDGWDLLPLKSVVDTWKFLKGLQKQSILDMDGETNSDFVKPVWWHERWIPLFHDRCGNNLCLDLVPKRGGKRGQLVSYYHDADDRFLIADGLESYLRLFADRLSANRYFVNKRGTLTLKEDE